MITIYSTTTCAKCKFMKAFMERNNIPFTEVNIEEDMKAKAMLLSLNKMELPVISHDATILSGDFNSLKAQVLATKEN